MERTLEDFQMDQSAMTKDAHDSRVDVQYLWGQIAKDLTQAARMTSAAPQGQMDIGQQFPYSMDCSGSEWSQ